MCEAISASTILSAAMSGVGMLMQNDAQDSAARKQQEALNASLEQQDQFNRKAEQVTLNNAQEYDPAKRLERFQEAQQNAGDSLVKTLTAERGGSGTVGQNPVGRISSDYSADSAKRQADTLQASTDMARLMGKMRGASDMLTNEGYTNADYTSQLGMIGAQGNSAARANRIGINAAGQPDGTQLAAGGLMSGLGSSMMQSAMGGGGDAAYRAKLNNAASMFKYD
jgi:hypothetical protein